MKPARSSNKLLVEFSTFINSGLFIETSNSKTYSWITIKLFGLLTLVSPILTNKKKDSKLLVVPLATLLHK